MWANEQKFYFLTLFKHDKYLPFNILNNYTLLISFPREIECFLYSSRYEINYKFKFQNMVEVVKETKQFIQTYYNSVYQID